jgi:hypothetical protein
VRGKLIDGPGHGDEIEVGEPPRQELYWLPPPPQAEMPDDPHAMTLPIRAEVYRLERGWEYRTVALYQHYGRAA